MNMHFLTILLLYIDDCPRRARRHISRTERCPCCSCITSVLEAVQTTVYSLSLMSMIVLLNFLAATFLLNKISSSR